MSKDSKPFSPVATAALGVTALGVIAISANILVSSLGIGYRKADFTENRSLSLSEGTKAILGDLGAPVVIRYYATRSSDYMPQQLKLHMKRVDDLLRNYETLSKGRIRVDNLDPQPDTDAEDSANLDGIAGNTFDDQNIYFGLAISCLDRTRVIPFLDPRQETMLEYELSRAISEVSRPDKALIGLMSGLPIQGGPAMMPGQPGAQPWVIYQQLRQSYEVRDLTMTPEKIDPEIDVLLLFHPANITPEAEFAIDQYVLQGGTVIACLDPYSVAAQMSGGGNPMMGGGLPTASTLPTLLNSWGLKLDTQVLGDSKYQTTMAGNRPGLAVLTVPEEGMPQKDNVVTKDLNSLVFFLPGGLTITGNSGVATNVLVKSSDKAAFVDPFRASQLDPSLGNSFTPSGQSYPLVVHLSGTFKSAFPDGKPGAEEAKKDGEDQEKDQEDAAKPEEKKDEPQTPASLKEGAKPGNVFVIADVDAFFNSFAYDIRNFGGRQMVLGQINGNVSLFLNLIDQAASSPHLIGARSRAALSRPFTKIKDMEDAAERQVGEERSKFEKQVEEAQNKINELQRNRSENETAYLSPEQEAEIAKLRADEVTARKAVRELEKGLKREKDSLTARIVVLNLAIMPGLVILFGFGLFLKRRFSTRAR